MIIASAPALVSIMGQSALRSLVLGALAFAFLRLARLRDLRAETGVWTAVLVAALAMPLLAQVLPSVGVAVPVLPRPVEGVASGATQAARSGVSLGAIAAGVYLLGVIVALLRILAGLVLVAALYLRADPIDEPWAAGRAIRASAAVDGPLSFARCILLPGDYRSWPQAKLDAVLAHEDCHIGRGDFFIQLLASVHRALFWFSPFPWWLQRKLGELAETASDAAGARRIGDAASYAEILVDVTRAARSGAGPAAALAMAHGPSLARRVDHILTAAPERSVGKPVRVAALSAVAGAAFALAGLHAVALAEAHSVRPGPSASLARQPVSANPSARLARRGGGVRLSSSARLVRARGPAAQAAASTPVLAAAVVADADAPSYDPLALVRDNDIVAVMPVLISGRRAAQAVQ